MITFPVTEEQLMKFRRRQLEWIINALDLPIEYEDTTLKYLRTEILEELKNYEEGKIEEVFIPSGNHASVNKKDQLYESPSGTEIFVVMDEMLKGVSDFSENSKIKDFGKSVYDSNDDYDDDDYDETKPRIVEEQDTSADKSFNRNYNRYSEETEKGFEKRTNKKYLKIVQPEVFFSFVKSKMQEGQITNLESRISAISSGIRSAEILGQQGLYEELALSLAGIVKEQEAFVIGCNKWIPYIAVNFFLEKVNSGRKRDDKKVVFDFFKRFPRLVPEEQLKRIKEVQDSGVFDQLYILYNSPTKSEPITTTKEKIRKKDPIVFGVFTHQPDRLYYICDWIDEFCDITLESFIKVVEENPDMIPQEIQKEITPEYIQNIIENVNKSHLRLKKTSNSNYRKLMRMEDEQRDKMLREAKEVASLPEETKKVYGIFSWLNKYLNPLK